MSWNQVDTTQPVFVFDQQKDDPKDSNVWDEMAAAYKEGVQEA